MNKAEKKRLVDTNRKKYRIIGGQNYQFPTKNAIYLCSRNKVKHELSKSLGGIMCLKFGDIKWSDKLVELLKEVENEVNRIFEGFPKEKTDFITECILKKEPNRRIDLTMLKDETKFEWETDKKICKENSITIYI